MCDLKIEVQCHAVQHSQWFYSMAHINLCKVKYLTSYLMAIVILQYLLYLSTFVKYPQMKKNA